MCDSNAHKRKAKAKANVCPVVGCREEEHKRKAKAKATALQVSFNFRLHMQCLAMIAMLILVFLDTCL